ncbi:hypothetical protein Ancab_005604 [Ancistrocladus abbreviatus]
MAADFAAFIYLTERIKPSTVYSYISNNRETGGTVTKTVMKVNTTVITGETNIWDGVLKNFVCAATEICSNTIEGMKMEYVDVSPLPMYNNDLEVDGKYPAECEAFRKKIRDADCFFFACHEHNYTITGTFFTLLSIT